MQKNIQYGILGNTRSDGRIYIQKATVEADVTLTVRKQNHESCNDTASFDRLATVKNDYRDAVDCLVGYTK